MTEQYGQVHWLQCFNANKLQHAALLIRPQSSTQCKQAYSALCCSPLAAYQNVRGSPGGSGCACTSCMTGCSADEPHGDDEGRWSPPYMVLAWPAMLERGGGGAAAACGRPNPCCGVLSPAAVLCMLRLAACSISQGCTVLRGLGLNITGDRWPSGVRAAAAAAAAAAAGLQVAAAACTQQQQHSVQAGDKQAG
jgi:hypothetical protein